MNNIIPFIFVPVLTKSLDTVTMLLKSTYYCMVRYIKPNFNTFHAGLYMQISLLF